MKKIFFIIILTLSLFQECKSQEFSSNKCSGDRNLRGFVFINISTIFNDNGNVTILNSTNDTILSIKGQSMYLMGKIYKAIDEEYLYKEMLNVEALDTEYGIFVLKCYGISKDSYRVEINGKIYFLVRNRQFENYIEFKNFENYILNTYPIPTESNPVRIESNKNSRIVEDFDKWTFIPVEIKGEWLKVMDNKDCYKGTNPSPNKIVGWIRWKKNGIFILKVAYLC